MKKRKIIHEVTYRKNAMMLPPKFLPTLNHADRFDVIECELQRAGAYDDGTEFQVLHVVLKERT